MSDIARETSPTPTSDFIDEHQFTPSPSRKSISQSIRRSISPEQFGGQEENEEDLDEEMRMRMNSRSQYDMSISVGSINYSTTELEESMASDNEVSQINPTIHDAENVLIQTESNADSGVNDDDANDKLSPAEANTSGESTESMNSSVIYTPSFVDPDAPDVEVADALPSTGGHITFCQQLSSEIESLLASGDTAGLRAHFARLQAELANEKDLSEKLQTQTLKLEEEIQATRESAMTESIRAREAERIASEAAAAAAAGSQSKLSQPMLVKDGIPLMLASASSQLITQFEVDKENMSMNSQVCPFASPSRQFHFGPSTAPKTSSHDRAVRRSPPRSVRKSVMNRSLLEPTMRTRKLCGNYSRDIKEQLNAFAIDMHETTKLIVGALMAHEASTNADTLMKRYQAERKQRQRLHDQLLELQGNIRVFARIRPLMSNTASNASGSNVSNVSAANSLLTSTANDAGRLVKEIEQDATRYIDEQTMGHLGKVYDFDKILHQQSTQEEVYKNVAPFLQSVVDGQNLCIFAYGQTGSGKTYTMDGTPSNVGVNIRALRHLFQLLNEKSNEMEWKVKFQAVEIYNEQPRDLLLDPSVYKKSLHTDAAAAATKLEIHQSPDGSIHIPGLSERYVKNEVEVTTLMQTHVKVNRSTAATSMNEYSSRSHMLIFLHIDGQPKAGYCEDRISSRLVLIDLAGSEKTKKSEATGQAMKEATHINKSLLALGEVISALKTKAQHVPCQKSNKAKR